MKKNKGFTLIELLTVIAIIGILSSIVYVSLSQIRLKSKDTAVKTQLSNMKVQAEIFFDMYNTYNEVCDTLASSRGFGGSDGPGLLKATRNVTAIPSTINLTLIQSGNYNVITCHASAVGWAVEAPLSKSALDAPVMYCVDSRRLTAKEETNKNLDGSEVVC